MAETHYKLHGRPLRVALDQYSWDYGVTSKQQKELRRTQRNEFYERKEREQFQVNYKRPPEKFIPFQREVNVFERLAPLIALNIQFHIILPHPNDKHRPQNGDISVWFKLMGFLGITYHTTKNTESECAHMQAKGLVDVAWSNRADILAFAGPNSIIWRDVKGEDSKISNDEVHVYDTHALSNAGLGWEEVLLFQSFTCFEYPDEIELQKKGKRNKKDKPFVITEANLASTYNQCRNQEDLNEWVGANLKPYFKGIKDNRPEYPKLEEYRRLSVIASLEDSDSQEFRHKIDTRLDALAKDSWPIASEFYMEHCEHKTKMLLKYSQDEFAMSLEQFAHLISGIFIARRLNNKDYPADLPLPNIQGETSATVKFPLDYESYKNILGFEEPRHRPREDHFTGIIEPSILTALVVEQQRYYQELYDTTLANIGSGVKIFQDASPSERKSAPQGETTLLDREKKAKNKRIRVMAGNQMASKKSKHVTQAASEDPKPTNQIPAPRPTLPPKVDVNATFPTSEEKKKRNKKRPKRRREDDTENQDAGMPEAKRRKKGGLALV
ncbi:hypothetical protein AA313_de0207641 [Arthrobotrys entomopaga]|nr:hypothetical protein AA313_de0207641 [Arthrobotrys entomopaga]